MSSGPVEGARPLKGATLIGLTGGIACGKSSVSRLLKAKGAFIVDADEVSRAVVEPGSVGLSEIVARWGEGVLNAQGELDRAKLGAHIFAEPEGRRALEALLHPLIAEESERRLAQALALSPPLVVYDAALLIEAGRAERFRPLVVVYASIEVQRARLISRDGLTSDEANARLKAQLSAKAKCEHADWVIVNDLEGLEGLSQAVEELWRALMEGSLNAR